MIRKCVYCKCKIEDDRAVDVCDRCGVGVWGERMFKAIIENMGQAQKKGDLNQGLVNLGGFRGKTDSFISRT